MSVPNTPPATFAKRKTSETAPIRIAVKSKKAVPTRPAEPCQPVTDRSPSYTGSLDCSSSNSSHGYETVETQTIPPVHGAEDGIGEVTSAQTHTGSDRDDPDGEYYVLRPRPALTVAERVEKLKAAQAEALRERAAEQLPLHGIARRPATLIRNRRGVVRANTITTRTAHNSGPEQTLALQDRPPSACGSECACTQPSHHTSSLSASCQTSEDADGAMTKEGQAPSPREEVSTQPVRTTSPVKMEAGPTFTPLKIDRDDEDDEVDGGL